MAGKYAFFVWGAYGVSLVAFALMAIDTVLRARAAKRLLQRLESGGASDG